MRGITVVIPTIRLDSYLQEAIDSVLASTDVDVELIVVHDGIVPDWNLAWVKDPRVTIVHLPEQSGGAAAMQAGVDLATNDLIARLDGDDLSFPTRLRRQADFLDNHPEAVAVGSRVMRMDAEGTATTELWRPVGIDIRRQMLLQNVVAHSALMFRAASLREVGGYDPLLFMMDDYDVQLRLARLGAIGNLDEILVSYRVHAGQMSRGAKPWGIHIRKVMKGRRDLRRTLKTSAAGSVVKDLVWVGVQYLRYYRVIRPGYER